MAKRAPVWTRWNAKQKETIDAIKRALSAIGALDKIDGRRVTPLREARLCSITLILGGVAPAQPIAKAQAGSTSWKGSSTGEILKELKDGWCFELVKGSYDDVRRKDLRHLLEFGVACPPSIDLAINDGANRRYTLSPEFCALLQRASKTSKFTAESVKQYKAAALVAEKARTEEIAKASITIRLADGTDVNVGTGTHQKLILSAADLMLGLIAEDAKDNILYAQSAVSGKYDGVVRAGLDALGIGDFTGKKAPDLIAYSAKRQLLIIIEAVTSSNPITEWRKKDILSLLEGYIGNVALISAFPTRQIFGKNSSALDWDTLAWVQECPHQVVFFGDFSYGAKFVTLPLVAKCCSGATDSS